MGDSESFFAPASGSEREVRVEFTSPALTGRLSIAFVSPSASKQRWPTEAYVVPRVTIPAYSSGICLTSSCRGRLLARE